MSSILLSKGTTDFSRWGERRSDRHRRGPPRSTSRTCPSCTHAGKGNRVTRAKSACTACGFTVNADHVGASNVLGGPGRPSARRRGHRHGKPACSRVGGVTAEQSQKGGCTPPVRTVTVTYRQVIRAAAFYARRD
ncbi:zinc ribbon domain-containing protein [Streptomyces sp. HNM0645]|nr:zinc ribbon domain-containing protein [Streptomyces sp. HNM0645]MDI9887803.1 zinc ribbon domain-containing protein [Streptomyces sp. HNM0645]